MAKKFLILVFLLIFLCVIFSGCIKEKTNFNEEKISSTSDIITPKEEITDKIPHDEETIVSTTHDKEITDMITPDEGTIPFTTPDEGSL